jgi:hypothetical protein
MEEYGLRALHLNAYLETSLSMQEALFGDHFHVNRWKKQVGLDSNGLWVWCLSLLFCRICFLMVVVDLNIHPKFMVDQVHWEVL